ncbi:MAG: hypothetical protein R2684_09145 [Pyrinomonadaceae bacterium]
MFFLLHGSAPGFGAVRVLAKDSAEDSTEEVRDLLFNADRAL